jgi:uncharacterized protein
VTIGAPNRRRNALANEASPYLRQHAENPVDWMPWSDAAFARAEREDKPVFLSVGYAACHWCHVMERESFENDEIAADLNEHFVSIKVDREELPDVDHHYMSIVQSLTGSGGWPMSVFLTAQRQAFFGGTYWPATSNYGRPGFHDVLRAIVDAWQHRRDDVEHTARAIQESLASSSVTGADGELHHGLIAHAVESALARFDQVNGGFDRAPKFPHAMELALLLRVAVRERNAQAQQVVTHSLRKMVRGGICDQIGGGFHRYSTDDRWLVPHFEKMLYDNALLIPLLIDAGHTTGDRELFDAARSALDWALREMEVAEGGFASSLDADTDGAEGLTYLWTPAEMCAVLGAERGARGAAIHDVTADGNFENSRSIPQLPVSVDDWAKRLGVAEDLLRAELAEDRAALLRARSKRRQPARDDKMLTDWNGLMISALVRGYEALAEPSYLAAAERTARRILGRFVLTGRLPHSHLGTSVQDTQFLLDHAAFGAGLLDLFQATGESCWFEAAVTLADRIEMMFNRGEQLYKMSERDIAGVEPIDPFDNATPSGISLAATLFIRLFQFTALERFRMRAEHQLRLLAAWMERAPAAFGQALTALEMLLHPPAQLVIVGDAGHEFARVADAMPRSMLTVIAMHDDSSVVPELLAPLVEGKSAVDGRATAYLCRDFACERPVTDAEELRRTLAVLLHGSDPQHG